MLHWLYYRHNCNIYVPTLNCNSEYVSQFSHCMALHEKRAISKYLELEIENYMGKYTIIYKKLERMCIEKFLVNRGTVKCIVQSHRSRK